MANLLILTRPIQEIIHGLPWILEEASKYAAKRLYIHLDSLSVKRTPSAYFTLPYRSYVISTIYSRSCVFCPNVDVRILMYGFKENTQFLLPNNQIINRILIDRISAGDQSELLMLENKYEGLFNGKKALILLNEKVDTSANGLQDLKDVSSNKDDKIYSDVVLGGTFDRIHPGHKILLSESILRTTNRLTIGVADGRLLKRKVLKELIKPCEERIDYLRNFVSDIDSTVEYNIVKIEEPMGPTSWDPKMEMIVVSEETKKGVELINNYRQERDLNILNFYCIKLFNDSCNHSKEEEAKFSSSSQRMRILGTRIQKVTPNLSIPPTPYIIGLTGGSASGKTKIAFRLIKFGAAVIDCDKLGHRAYLKGSACYYQLIETFGKEIIDGDEEINRKVLGKIVFNNKEKLAKLNSLIWPLIAQLTLKEIEEHRKNGKKVVILDAAVLLEASWEKYCHEVWVSIISHEEAIKRIMNRDRISENDAANRLEKQLSNEERIAHANIVFCSQWSYDYTQQQVEKAWNILKSESIV